MNISKKGLGRGLSSLMGESSTEELKSQSTSGDLKIAISKLRPSSIQPRRLFDKRNKLSTQVAMDVKKHLQEKVFETMIPRNVRVSEAPSFGMPAIVYDRKSKGSQAYLKLADEILKKNNNKEAA